MRKFSLISCSQILVEKYLHAKIWKKHTFYSSRISNHEFWNHAKGSSMGLCEITPLPPPCMCKNDHVYSDKTKIWFAISGIADMSWEVFCFRLKFYFDRLYFPLYMYCQFCIIYYPVIYLDNWTFQIFSFQDNYGTGEEIVLQCTLII